MHSSGLKAPVLKQTEDLTTRPIQLLGERGTVPQRMCALTLHVRKCTKCRLDDHPACQSGSRPLESEIRAALPCLERAEEGGRRVQDRCCGELHDGSAETSGARPDAGVAVVPAAADQWCEPALAAAGARRWQYLRHEQDAE